MSSYSTLIDPAEFGLIADYLRSPRSPIDYLLHVKSRDMLALLAEELDRQHHVDTPPWLFPEAVERGLRDGSLRISARHPVDLSNPTRIVEAKAIPRQATCDVIYAPPFYLVHTPGLLEGTLMQPKSELKSALDLHRKRGSRIKL